MACGRFVCWRNSLCALNVLYCVSSSSRPREKRASPACLRSLPDGAKSADKVEKLSSFWSAEPLKDERRIFFLLFLVGGNQQVLLVNGAGLTS